MGQAHLGTFDLAISGLTPQMGRHLVDVGHPGGPDRVSLGDEATRHVHRSLPIAKRRPRVDELSGPAPLA